MSTPKFIVLHPLNGIAVRVKRNAISSYRPVVDEERGVSQAGAASVMLNGAAIIVTETPEQIDALLGVTQPVDIAAAVMKAMDASDERIEDRTDDYCAGFDDAHAIFYQRVRAALSAATGQESAP